MCGGFFMEALRILNVSVYLYNTQMLLQCMYPFLQQLRS